MDEVARSLIEAQEKARALFAEVVAGGLIVPGKLESELSTDIHHLARERFGLRRHWHKRIARAGENTMLGYHDEPADRRIAADDVVYLDFGPVFEAWEADYGRTYVVGSDPVKRRLVADIGHDFVFVTAFPASGRPFYHMRPEGRPDLTLSYDLLWKGLEITTGAQREHRYDILLRQAAEAGLSPEPMEDYLNCFRYGCPPHGGFGLGLGRLLMTLLDLDSLREATFRFRGPNRLAP